MSEKIKVLITTESLTDMPNILTQKLPIEIIPYYINTKKGRFRDRTEIDCADLIRYLDEEGNKAFSEECSVEDLKGFFADRLKTSEHIIHITVGRNSSLGYERAVEAAKDLKGVTVFDSSNISSGAGLVVIKAAELARDGKAADEIIAVLEDYVKAVSMSFFVKDMAYLDDNKRIPHIFRVISERLFIRPAMKMKNRSIKLAGVVVGNWENSIRRFVRKAIKYTWKIDREKVIITCVGLDEKTIDIIKEEIERIIHFEKVHVVTSSAVIAVNTGAGTFGICYAYRFEEKDEKEEKGRMASFRDLVRRGFNIIANEELPIRNRILNLILFAAVVGGFVSLIVTAFLDAIESVLIIAALLLVMSFALWLSVVKRLSRVAAIIVCIMSNVILFPLMYYYSGGTQSGMPIWFTLGLLFVWLLLTGHEFWIILILDIFAFTMCILVGNYHPEIVARVTESYTMKDIIQTAIIVSCILGVIFKYQAFVYERQQKKIKEHEEELERSNRAKDLFLANMSHEIRTPINGILGMNTMLLRECEGDETLMEYGRNIRSAGQTLLSLINDILDISKVEAGKLEVIPIEYDLFSLINDCYQMAYSRAIEKGLDFELIMSPEIPGGLYGDEIRIKQIINNITSNAVKYTDSGSVRMVIDMEDKSDAMLVLKIRVSDTGIGIRQEDMNDIFEGFTRVDEKKNRKVEGTGLGLNLTKKLAEMMDGSITVDSIYGQGSTFTVRIPQRIKNRNPVGEFAERYRKYTGESESREDLIYAPSASVLVVDDVRMNILVAKGFMKYTGIRVDTADSGKEALSMTGKKQYDIIFMDHLMPEMDGIECLHLIRENLGGPNIATPVIVLTANAASGIREEYIRTGFNDYLPKPMTESELQNILRRYIPKEKIEEHFEIPAETVRQEKAEITADVKSEEKKGDLQHVAMKEREGQGMDKDEKSAENPEITPSEITMEKLGNIDGIDTAEGLKYCMDDEGFYLTVVGEYLKDDRSKALERNLADENFEEYRVNVHSMKSSALNIGALHLSNEAKISEQACKDGDFDLVRQRHEKLLDEYMRLVNDLKR